MGLLKTIWQRNRIIIKGAPDRLAMMAWVWGAVLWWLGALTVWALLYANAEDDPAEPDSQ